MKKLLITVYTCLLAISPCFAGPAELVSSLEHFSSETDAIGGALQRSKRSHRSGSDHSSKKRIKCKIKDHPTVIDQCQINKQCCTLTLTKSGSYILGGDILGTIVIAGNSISLNLNSHNLNANGKANAIIINSNVQNVKVYNGRITNASKSAILVNENCSAIALYDLDMVNNPFNSIRIISSFDILVKNIDFVNSNSGERALKIDSCYNVAVDQCAMSGFFSTIGAILEINDSTNVTVNDVVVSYNTKTNTAVINEFDVATAFVGVNSCSGIDFARVKVNNNTINNTIPVADQSIHWRTAEAIAFLSSQTCTMHQCETSNNTDSAGAIATPDTEDYMLLFLGCENCQVTEHLSNNNSCTAPIAYFIGTMVADSNSMVLDECQSNSNFAAELNILPFDSQLIGFWIAPYFDGPVNDNVLKNSQSNFNQVADGGAGRTSGGANVRGIEMASSGIITHCQVNHNSMGTTGDIQAVWGIFAPSAKDITISHSSADNNTGGGAAFGIEIIQCERVVVSHCSASSNSFYGLLLGDPNFGGPCNDVEIIDCVCHGNGTNAFTFPLVGPAGIGIFASSTNIFIKGCQVYDTFANGYSTAGINAVQGSNVVIEDCNIFKTTSTTGAGFGILFDTLTDSKIIRTQVHENQNCGVELVGTNTNVAIIDSIAIDNNLGFNFASGSIASYCLVQDCRALSNTTCGFQYAASTPLTTTFIGNEAQFSADNYLIIGGIISLQSLSWTTGNVTHKTGDSNTGPWTNFEAVP